MKNKSGYILVFTLILVSMSIILVSYITTRGMAYVALMRTMIDREKSTALAFGGVNIALSQLAFENKNTPAQGAQQGQAAQPEESDEKKLLSLLLLIINRWQTVTLTKNRDGIKADLKICIVCEQGKIDINEIYDFKEQKFVGEGKPQGDKKKWMQEFFTKLEEHVQGKNLFEAFEKFLKERQYKVRDATELLTSPEFASFKQHVWYEPSLKNTTGKDEKEESPVFLTDIFTTWSHTPTLEPWLLSDSLRGVLGLERTDNEEKNSEQVTELMKNFKQKSTWATDWDTVLAPRYNKELTTLPTDTASMLSASYKPTVFSVLSYAKVGTATQRLYAIVERKKEAVGVRVSIKKLYWL